MTYTIKNNCILCDSCQPQCPNGAIKPDTEQEGYWIDPTLCDGCPDLAVPRCVEVCSADSLIPLQAKKGRRKSSLLPPAIPNIFLNGKTTPFASSMVIWEACNLLAQRPPWQTEGDNPLFYTRPVHRGRGELRFRLATDPESKSPIPMPPEEATIAFTQFDIRATCIHLIFAAYAVTVDCPWEQAFVLNDQHIEKYLGLDKRKDLTKLDRLTLIKSLVHQSCQLLVALDWPRQGKVKAFSLDEHPIWHLIDTQYYFETDSQGYRHLIGLGFTVKAGVWARQFLNKQDYRSQTTFYQYGILPQSLLTEVMGSWQQHEGAIRLLLWLLFKLRLGGDHRLTIRTLLRIAYGETKVAEATTVRGAHKRLLKTFESDLETICNYGLRPLFDPDTYPSEIQPLWVRAARIPDDVDAALDFWIDDAKQTQSLTDSAPKDKWQRLMNARILGFELSEQWQHTVRHRTPKRRQAPSVPRTERLSAGMIKAARQRHNFTQRALAERLGKSQSWVRDIENGRFSLSYHDQLLLRQTLTI
ncbi:MAG: helix-turn-helix domain-containing protein [Cyanobacteria bacterium P01_H01_bin.26]